MTGLIGCESSGVVRSAFNKGGHRFISCDLLPAEDAGDHYIGDVLSIIDNDFDFIGLHPACTYMANSGVCHLYNKDGSKNLDRWVKLEHAVCFFNLLKSKIKIGYIENPIPHGYAKNGFYSVVTGDWVQGVGQYSQTIQPYNFGENASKRTCLWLFGLPNLEATKYIYPRVVNGKKLWSNQTDSGQNKLPPSKDRWKLRSRTYQGIADAMAKQWG